MKLKYVFNPHNVEPKVDISDKIHISTPIEETLHVITVISNICEYRKRWILANEFIGRMEKEKSVQLYIVELAYGNQKHVITDAKNPRHLQLRVQYPLWHKENLINIGVKKLLPDDWKAVAWIDADVEFDSPHWVQDTLKLLNGTFDVVQLFSNFLCLDKDSIANLIQTSFGYNYIRNLPYIESGCNYWQAGMAWATTRSAFEKMGGLHDIHILGSADICIAVI